MKKILAVILSLCLLCGAVALASEASNEGTATWNNTTVISYKIEAASIIDKYTITIPSTLDLDTNGAGILSLKITPAEGFNAAIKVSLYMDKAEGSLTNTDSTVTIPYTITKSGNSLNVSDPVLVMDGTSGVPAEAAQDFNVSANISAVATAGTYSDTLTFRVSVE